MPCQEEGCLGFEVWATASKKVPLNLTLTLNSELIHPLTETLSFLFHNSFRNDRKVISE